MHARTDNNSKLDALEKNAYRFNASISKHFLHIVFFKHEGADLTQLHISLTV